MKELFLVGVGLIVVAIFGGAVEVLGVKAGGALAWTRVALAAVGLALCVPALKTPKAREELIGCTFGCREAEPQGQESLSSVATPPSRQVERSSAPAQPNGASRPVESDETSIAASWVSTATSQPLRAVNDCAVSDIIESCFDDEQTCREYIATRPSTSPQKK